MGFSILIMAFFIPFTNSSLDPATLGDFVIGKRVAHFKPFAFVIVLTTIYGLLYHFLIPNSSDIEIQDTSRDVLGVYEKVINWSLNHFAYATSIMIISTTIASHRVFKKQGYNLAEHLVLNTHYRGLVLVVSILLFSVLYILRIGDSESLKLNVPIFQLVDLGLMYWCYGQFFNKLPKVRSLWLTVLTYLFTSSINLLLAFISGLIANAVD